MLHFKQKLNAFQQGTEALSSSSFRTEIVSAGTQDMNQDKSTVYLPTATDKKMQRVYQEWISSSEGVRNARQEVKPKTIFKGVSRL